MPISVLAPPGGKTSVNLFGAEPAEHQPVQRGAKHPDRNASNVCFEAPEKQASRSSANKPADNSANNLFGPPPKRDVPKPKADSHNTLFGPAEPPAPKAVQTGKKNAPSLPNGPIICAEPDSLNCLSTNAPELVTTPRRQLSKNSPTTPPPSESPTPSPAKKVEKSESPGVWACMCPADKAKEGEQNGWNSTRMSKSVTLPGKEENLPNTKKTQKRQVAKAVVHRDPIKGQGDFSTELKSRGKKPASPRPQSGGRNPISGSTDIENTPPCGQHHRRHIGRSIESDPIRGTGADLHTYDIARESRVRTQRPKSALVQSNPLSGENCASFDIHTNMKTKSRGQYYSRATVKRNPLTGENCEDYILGSTMTSKRRHIESSRAPCNPLTGENCASYTYATDARSPRAHLL